MEDIIGLIKTIWGIAVALKWLWPFLLIVLLLNILPYIMGVIKQRYRFRLGKEWRSDNELIRWLRNMRPTEFEEYIAELFRRLGYKTYATGGSHDEGIDVIAEKDDKKHYIQCKKYFSRHQVGSPEVREFYGALVAHYGNSEGWFITTNKFTPEAEKFADDKPIVLINQFELVKYIRNAEKAGFNNRPQVEINLKCPKCGGKLEEKTGKYGKFFGCSNYPKCQYAENMNKN